MDVLNRVLARELDPHWLRFLLVLPADAVTLLGAFGVSEHIASRVSWLPALRGRLISVLAGAGFLAYFLAIRPRLLESPVFFAFPYFFVGLASAYCIRVLASSDRAQAANTASLAIDRLVVPLPRDLLIWSMVVGGIVMIAFTLPHVIPFGLTALGDGPWFPAGSGWFASLGALQLISLIAVMVIATRYFTKTVGVPARLAIPAVVLLLVFAIGVELIAEELIFKGTFRHARPPDRPQGSSEIHRALGLRVCDGWSRPSGVVVRQTMLLLATLQVAFANRRFLRGIDRVLILTVVFLTPLLSVLRINGTTSGLFDVGFAVGLGVLLFWLLVVGGTTLLARGPKKNESFNFFVGAQSVCLSYVIFLAFWENAMGLWWITLALSTTMMLYVLRESSDRIQTLFGHRN